MHLPKAVPDTAAHGRAETVIYCTVPRCMLLMYDRQLIVSCHNSVHPQLPGGGLLNLTSAAVPPFMAFSTHGCEALVLSRALRSLAKISAPGAFTWAKFICRVNVV